MELPSVPSQGDGGLQGAFATLADATDRATWPEIDKARRMMAQLPPLEDGQEIQVGDPRRIGLTIARGPKGYELGVWYGNGSIPPLILYHFKAQSLDSGPYSCDEQHG